MSSANELNTEIPDKPKQETPQPNWEVFESSINRLLGSSSERIEREREKSSTGDFQAGVGRDGGNQRSNYYDQQGRPIGDLNAYGGSQPILKLVTGENGQKTLEIFANKNSALSGAPILKEVFSYKQDANHVVESRSITSAGKLPTVLEISFDKKSKELSFSTTNGPLNQTITLDANSNAVGFELRKGASKLSYNFENGIPIDVTVDQGLGPQQLDPYQKEAFLSSADQTIAQVRRANGIPDPFEAGGSGNGEFAGANENREFAGGNGNRGNGDRLGLQNNNRVMGELGKWLDTGATRATNPGLPDANAVFGIETPNKFAGGGPEYHSDANDRRREALLSSLVSRPPNVDPDSYAALKEVFKDFGPNLRIAGNDVGHHAVNIGFTRLYFTGDANDRQSAMRGLENEVIQGDNQSALQVLKDLSLVDAVRQLRTAASPDETKAALKALAALELGDPNNKQAKHLLEKYPSAKDLGAYDSSADEKTKMVAEARQEAKEERFTRLQTNSHSIIDIVTGSPQDRQAALERLGESARSQLHKNDADELNNLSKLEAVDKILQVTEALSPQDAAAKLVELIQMQNTFNNKTAAEALKGLDGPAMVDRLRNSDNPGDQTKALEELKQHFDPTKKQVEEFKTKSATDILEEFGDKTLVQNARKEMIEFANANYEKADHALETFLDRNSTKEQRKEALETLERENESRVRTLKSEDFVKTTQTAQTAVALDEINANLKTAYKGLKDSPDSAETKAALKNLETSIKQYMKMSGLDGGTGSNPQAIASLMHSKSSAEIGDLVKKLTTGSSDSQKEAIENLIMAVPKSDDLTNPMRLGRVLRDINEMSTPDEFQKAIDALDSEVKAKNDDAQEWKDWASTGKAISQITNAQSAADITAASTQLAKMAEQKNPFAVQALAGMLMGGADSEAVRKWYGSGNGVLKDKPVFIPHMDKVTALGAEGEAAWNNAKLDAAKQIENLVKTRGLEAGNDAGLHNVKGVFNALSIALAHEQSNGATNKELISTLESTFKSAIGQNMSDKSRSHYSRAAVEGLHEAIQNDVPGSKELVDLFMLSAKSSEFRGQVITLGFEARNGNEAAIGVLAATTSGLAGNPELQKEAAAVLRSTAEIPQLREKVVAALIRASQTYQDSYNTIETLGRIASTYENAEAVPKELRDAINEGVSSQNASTNMSATRGLMAMANVWTEREQKLAFDYTNKHTAEGFRAFGDKIPEPLRNQLMRDFAERANPSTPSDQALKLATLESLGSMAQHLSRRQLSVLASYGSDKGLALAKSSGIDTEQAKDLQKEAGKAIFAALVKGDLFVRKDALSAVKDYQYGGVTENRALRDVLVKMAKNEPFDLELYETMNKLVYETGMPRPAAGILKQWNVPAINDAEYFEKAATVMKNYENFAPGVTGEQMVRRVATNLELFNSLSPDLRQKLFRDVASDPAAAPFRADPISPQQVAKQMEAGLLQESNNAFLLRDLKAELGALTRQANIDSYDQKKQLEDLHEKKVAQFHELTSFTSKDVALTDKLLYVGDILLSSPVMVKPFGFDPYSEYETKQNELIAALPKFDSQIAEVSTKVARTDNLLNQYGFSAKVAEYTDLKNTGQQREADKLLVGTLWAKNGDLLQQFAPSIYADLVATDSKQINRSAFGRLNTEEIGVFKEMPLLTLGTEDSMKQGLAALAKIPDGKAWLTDSRAVTEQALASIESSAGITKLGDVSRKINGNFLELQELLTAAQTGRKYDGLVDEMKSRGKNLQDAINGITVAERAAIEKDIDSIKTALQSDIQDKDVKEKLKAELKTLEDMNGLINGTSENGKVLHEVIKKTMDPNFKADTLVNWLKERGPIIAATLVAVGLTVAACTTLGLSSPLAIAAWCSVAGLAAEELTIYGLSKLNEGGYTGWGTAGQRNKLQEWSDLPANQRNFESFMTNVAAEYGLRVLKDTALAFATMGLTKFALSGFNPSQLGLRNLALLAKGEGPSLVQGAMQMQRAQLIAQGEGTAGLYMKTFLKESGKEMLINSGMTFAQLSGEEAINELSPDSWKKALESSQQSTSFGLGTVLAIGQGVLASFKHGGNRTFHFEANNPAGEAKFIGTYAREGFTIKPIEPGKWAVWPPNAHPKTSEPFYLQRGTGTPPVKVFPDGYKPPAVTTHVPETTVRSENGHTWNQIENGAKQSSQLTSFTDHFSNGRFREALQAADSNYPEGHEVRRKPIEATAESLQNPKELGDFLLKMGDNGGVNSRVEGGKNKFSTDLPQTIIEIAGTKVDLVTGKTPGGKPLAPHVQAKFDAFANGEIGQRLLAEHAIIAAEERVHLRNFESEGHILSPSFAKFASETGTSGSALESAFQGKAIPEHAQTEGRAPHTYEQEALLALHDSNPKFWTADMLQRHFGSQHEAVRKPVIEWVRQQEQASASKAAGDAPETPKTKANNEPSTVPRRTNSAEGHPTDAASESSRLGRNQKYQAELTRLESEGTDNFHGKTPPAQQTNPARGQQEIFLEIRKSLERKGPNGKSLADEGWSLFQSHKNSPADLAKMDYILVNENTGQYHILDATANTKDVQGGIRQDSIIKFDPQVDIDGRSLVADARARVDAKVHEMVNKPSALNLNDHPPPSLKPVSEHNPSSPMAKPKDIEAALEGIKNYREKLAASGDPRITDYNNELHHTKTFLEKTHESLTNNTIKGEISSFQAKAETTFRESLRALLTGKPSTNNTSGNKAQAKTDKSVNAGRDGLVLETEGKKMVWGKDQKELNRIVSEEFDKAIKNAKTEPERKRIYEQKQNLFDENNQLSRTQLNTLLSDTASKLRTLNNQEIFNRQAAKPAVTQTPTAKPGDTSTTTSSAKPDITTKDFLTGDPSRESSAVDAMRDTANYLELQAPKDGAFSNDVKSMLEMNYDEAVKAVSKDGEQKSIVDDAKKLLDAYTEGNPAGIAKIHEYLSKASEKTVRLGRNETMADMLNDATKDGGSLAANHPDSDPDTAAKTAAILKDEIANNRLKPGQLENLLKLPPGDIEMAARWLRDGSLGKAREPFLDMNTQQMDAYLGLKQGQRAEVLTALQKGLIDGTSVARLAELGKTDPRSQASAMELLKLIPENGISPENMNRLLDQKQEFSAIKDGLTSTTAAVSIADLNLALSVPPRQQSSGPPIYDTVAVLQGLKTGVMSKAQVKTFAEAHESARSNISLLMKQNALSKESLTQIFQGLQSNELTLQNLNTVTSAQLRGWLPENTLTNLLSHEPAVRNRVLDVIASENIKGSSGSVSVPDLIKRVSSTNDLHKQGVINDATIPILNERNVAEPILDALLKSQASTPANQRISPDSIQKLVEMSRKGEISPDNLEAYRISINKGVLDGNSLKTMLEQDTNTRIAAETVMKAEPATFAQMTKAGQFNEMIAKQDQLVHAAAKVFPDMLPANGKFEYTAPDNHNSKLSSTKKDLAEFSALMDKGDYIAALQLMEKNVVTPAQKTNASIEPEIIWREKKIALADMNNPNALNDMHNFMLKQGNAEGTQVNANNPNHVQKRVDVADPVIELPDGKSFKLRDSSRITENGKTRGTTTAEKALIESIQGSPAGKAMIGKTAMVVMEEWGHTQQGNRGGLSPTTQSFAGSPEYLAMQKQFSDRGLKGPNLEASVNAALREIDIAAAMHESGFSNSGLQKLFGAQHLKGEREFFYRYLDRVGRSP